MKTRLKNFCWLIFGISVVPMMGMYMGEPGQIETEQTFPDYMQIIDYRDSIKILPPQTINFRGKIYKAGDYLMINEPNLGVHVFDNSSPETPIALAFIRVPGNFDMAVYRNVLYTDSFNDLVSFDLSNPKKIKMLYQKLNVLNPTYIGIDG